MSILLYVVLILFAICFGETTKFQQTFFDYQIIPDVVYVPPVCPLGVRYPNQVQVRPGDVLRQSEVEQPPSLRWGADARRYYTLILTDPDVPSATDPADREFLHWLVINIPGLRVSNGETVFEYVAPQPPANTGLHRYVFLVYEQPAKYTFTGPRELKNRARFSTEQFAAEHKLGVAVAGNFFWTQHEGNQQ